MMNIDLKILPYSRYGSYMVLSRIAADHRGLKNAEGLHLRTVHGSARTPLIASLRMIRGGSTLEPEASCLEETALVLKAEDAAVEMVYRDADSILVRGCGHGLSLELDFLTGTGPYDYIYSFRADGRDVYMANCYKNNNRYLIVPLKGQVCLEQKWEESSSLYSRLVFTGEEGFGFMLCEIETEWDHSFGDMDFDAARQKNLAEFEAFRKGMPSVPGSYAETAYKAAFLNWSSVVRKDGFLKRDGMFMSKNWMCNVWSWDHCFNAMALSYGNPEAAWDQFMVMFDLQDKTGLLPDSTNDTVIVWNYCKPPIHGWALRKMMEHMELSPQQKGEAYDHLERWTDWWCRYRDYDGDGLAEYNHGNDSGWDNSTAFSELPPVATAELQAFLVVQMQVLAHLAGDLGMAEAAGVWNRRADEMLQKMLEVLFRDGLPLSVHSGTHAVIANESLLPYVSIVLGKSLPEEIRTKMIGQLKSGGFYTEYGFATEKPESLFYRSDGYWRGPIWAPSTMLIVDGLARCGETEFVKDAVRRFSDMVKRSGFAENFDALTGEGLRDRAYTWTSSVFLILAHEYLED